MKRTTIFLTLLHGCLTLAQPVVNAESSVPCPWTDTVYRSQEEIVTNWYALWDGDYSYLEKTVTPDVHLYQDRFPTGNGSVSLPIFDSDAMREFVKTSREGWESYSFIDDFHYGVDNLITLRWTLNATWGGSDDRYVDVLILASCV